MKLPIKNISEFTQCELSLEELLTIISNKIGEVEGYTDFSEMYEGIVVAQIVDKKEHANANNLSIYMVNIGEGDNIQVVAGDKTLNIGEKVAYIKPGHTVPFTYGTSQPLLIKSANMRGVQSNGMMCSEKELNIGSDHERVLVLNPDAQVGVSFAQYYELNDVIIDIENKALTNRGDLFGILGLAREISAAQNIPFTSPKWYTEISSWENIPETSPIEVENRAKNLCPRYSCITMDGITVKESPIWLKSILLKSGIRPINNVVDITNYISIITGQPLHAFDYDKLVNNDPNSQNIAHIIVRVAENGEKIHTLDGNLVHLSENNLVIADSTNPIAIAGVIGGSDTEIDSNTKRIIIESASFDRFSIRKSSMKLGIFTEAVTRYTRGQSPNLCILLLLRSVELIKELTGGEVATNIVDVYSQSTESKTISLSISKLNTLLGTNLEKSEIRTILTNMEYGVESEDSEYITVQTPNFRTDLYIPEDVYEDIGRIYGYENILPELPLRKLSAGRVNKGILLKSKIRNILSYSGCNELDTYSFVSKNSLLSTKQDPNIAYHIKNALSPELEFMRPTLLISLIEKASYNIQKNISPFCIYEFNIPHQKGYLNNFQLPKEDWHLSLLFSSKENIFDGSAFYQVKRYFEKILDSTNSAKIQYTLLSESSQLDLPLWIQNSLTTFNKNECAIVKYSKDGIDIVLGIIGTLDSQVLNNYKLPDYTSAFEINLEALSKIVDKDKGNIDSSKYPPITQDLTITVSPTTKYGDLEELVLKIVNGNERIGLVECVDIYQKDENSSKNITLRITIEHKQKTLSDKDFNKLKEKIEEKSKVFNS